MPPALVDAIRVVKRGWADQRLLADLRLDLADCVNTLPLVDVLIRGGAIADVGRPLSFEGREFWRPIYESMYGPSFCVMSSAQIGKSIMLFYGIAAVALLFHARGKGIWHGLYLPTQEMVRVFSKGRLSPILRKIGEISGVRCGDVRPKDAADVMAAGGATAKRDPKEQDSYNFKRIGSSYTFLAWMHGALVDAFPLDVVWLDEVRLMEPGLVDRVEKRITGSPIGWSGFTSTAGMPGDAIDVRFDSSDQRHFHNDCKCPDGVELNKAWPACLGERQGKQADLRGRHYLYCPRCGTEIVDRGAGRWIAHNPGGAYPGFNPHKLITQQSLAGIVTRWTRPGRNDKEFMNSELGLTFMDAHASPLNQELLDACENPDLLWARPGDVARTAMGIDQMGGVNYYVVSERTRDDKRRIVHLEIGWSDDPFQRAGQLMREYDVNVCCVEPLPNYNDAVRFANEFASRVFLVDYQEMKGGAELDWKDRPVEREGQRKADRATKTRYAVAVDQTRMFDTLASHWRDRWTETPATRALRQVVQREGGGEIEVALCRDVYHDHLKRIARRERREKRTADGVDQKEETGRVRYHWVKLARAPDKTAPAPVKGAGADPHFAYAELMNLIAWTRLRPGGRKNRSALL